MEMKLKKKMVLVNVAIQICKEDPRFCGNTPEQICRFLSEEDGICILFMKSLKIAKEEPNEFLRCKPCLTAEPGK